MTVAQKLECHLGAIVCPYGVPLSAKEQLEYIARASLRQRQDAYIRALSRSPLLLDDEIEEALPWVVNGADMPVRESIPHRAQAKTFLVQYWKDILDAEESKREGGFTPIDEFAAEVGWQEDGV